MEVTLAVAGMLIGGVITWLSSRYYYKKAADDLTEETKRLQAAMSVVAYMLEHRDADVEVRRDDRGAVSGLFVKVRAVGGASFAGHATGTLTASAPAAAAGTVSARNS